MLGQDRWTVQYSKVEEVDEGVDRDIRPNWNRRWNNIWQTISLPAWILSICLWLTFLPFCLQLWKATPSNEACSEQLSYWSPAFEVMKVEDTQFENGFMEPSIYRGKPTPELEEAWSDLWNHGYITIPDEQLPALNKSITGNWERDSQGRVIANFEVWHDLHCLDFIRQYTYRDEYDYSGTPAFDGTPHMVREHVDHCINSLRLKIMCVADVTPLLHVIDESRPLGAVPDFNTQHKCRNFHDIRDWFKEQIKVLDESEE